MKVADFGIARAMNSAAESNLTQVGSVMGTATYFSPEQAQGAQPDPRSDLYSLGIVLYEMVGRPAAVHRREPGGIAYKQVHDAPQPLNQIVARRAPRRSRRSSPSCSPRTRRCATRRAEALRDDLRRFRDGEPVQALRRGWCRRPRPAAASDRAATMATPSTAGMAADDGDGPRRRSSRRRRCRRTHAW